MLGSQGFVDVVRIETLSHTNGAHIRSELNQTLAQGADNEVGIHNRASTTLEGWGGVKVTERNCSGTKQEDGGVATANILIN